MHKVRAVAQTCECCNDETLLSCTHTSYAVSRKDLPIEFMVAVRAEIYELQVSLKQDSSKNN